MTTIGYGDIPLLTNSERVFSIGAMFVASIIYGYTLTKISSIILDLDDTNYSQKLELKNIEEFMKKRKM